MVDGRKLEFGLRLELYRVFICVYRCYAEALKLTSQLDLVRRSTATSCNGFMESSRVELPAVFEEAPIDELVHLIGI